MAPAYESETIVFNFRKLLSTLPNYAELEQILLFSVNWGKQVCCYVMSFHLSICTSFPQLYMYLASCHKTEIKYYFLCVYGCED